MTTDDIHRTAQQAGERLMAFILELENDRNIPLERTVRSALYQAGTALAKLRKACLLADRPPVPRGRLLSDALERADRPRR